MKNDHCAVMVIKCVVLGVVPGDVTVDNAMLTGLAVQPDGDMRYAQSWSGGDEVGKRVRLHEVVQESHILDAMSRRDINGLRRGTGFRAWRGSDPASDACDEITSLHAR